MSGDDLLGFVYKCSRCSSKFPVYCRIDRFAEKRRCHYCQHAKTESPSAECDRMIMKGEEQTSPETELACA